MSVWVSVNQEMEDLYIWTKVKEVDHFSQCNDSMSLSKMFQVEMLMLHQLIGPGKLYFPKRASFRYSGLFIEEESCMGKNSKTRAHLSESLASESHFHAQCEAQFLNL